MKIDRTSGKTELRPNRGLLDPFVSILTRCKTAPAVSNTTREGRFVNRRVTLLVTDGQGRVIKEGGIRDVINAIPQASDCCNDVRRQLDKLDDILSALKNLQGENQKQNQCRGI